MSTEDVSEPRRGPKVRGKGGRGYSHANRKVMATFVVELRRDYPTMRYAEVRRRVMERFECGTGVAEKAMTLANETLREVFWQVASDAPRMVLDGYMEIFEEAMRDKKLTQARLALDSVRDMFGIRGAINVNLNIPNPAAAAMQDRFGDLTDEQLDALEALDNADRAIAEAASSTVIDVEEVDEVLEDVASAGAEDDDEPEEETDDDAPDQP